MALTGGLPITEAQLAGSFSASVLWGFHIITLGFCMKAFLRRGDQWKKCKEINWPMVLICLALFFTASFDVILGFCHTLVAFVFFKGAGGAAAEYTDISEWMNIARTVTLVVQVVIGDAVLIYRCWVVYQRSYLVIALSFILWLALMASGIWVIILEATLKSRALISAKRFSPAIITFCAVTIPLNIITTGQLVYRIWKVDKSGREYIFTGDSSQSQLRYVMRIIIESGMMYTAIAIVTFVCIAAGSNAVYLTSDMEVQIVGIAFDLILVRTTNYYSSSDGTSVDDSQPYCDGRRTNRKTEVYVSKSVARQGTVSTKGREEGESMSNYEVDLPG